MDRFKFRVYYKPIHEYVEQRDNLVLLPDGKLCEYDGIEIESDNYVFEMSTGLKDKNGNLIYEGDILLCDRKIVDCGTGEEIHYKKSGVVQREKNGQYFINGKDWYGSDITFYNECAEIIGNVHTRSEE